MKFVSAIGLNKFLFLSFFSFQNLKDVLRIRTCLRIEGFTWDVGNRLVHMDMYIVISYNLCYLHTPFKRVISQDCTFDVQEVQFDIPIK